MKKTITISYDDGKVKTMGDLIGSLCTANSNTPLQNASTINIVEEEEKEKCECHSIQPKEVTFTKHKHISREINGEYQEELKLEVEIDITGLSDSDEKRHAIYKNVNEHVYKEIDKLKEEYEVDENCKIYVTYILVSGSHRFKFNFTDPKIWEAFANNPGQFDISKTFKTMSSSTYNNSIVRVTPQLRTLPSIFDSFGDIMKQFSTFFRY